MDAKFQVQLKIRKPVAEVFDAVVNPAKLSSYFLQTSSGPLTEGATVKWKFAEVDQAFDVVVGQVVKDEKIVFDWPSAASGDQSNRVEMVFKPMDAQNTMVQISESGWPETPEGAKASHGNAAGWMHMMACLKAYLEYGINLRAGGAF
ncbi:SRPBCC domain-containing protein [soil metagenome]